MTDLNSLFDIVTRDPHPNALAGLMVILDVKNPPAVGAGGTPTPGTIERGHVLMMDPADGRAILGDSTGHIATDPQFYVYCVDGDTDYDGALMHRVTCIEGGMQLKTDKYDTTIAAVNYHPGASLTVGTAGGSNDGLLIPLTGATEPILGWVGPDGIHSDGTLDVLVPQGRSR